MNSIFVLHKYIHAKNLNIPKSLVEIGLLTRVVLFGAQFETVKCFYISREANNRMLLKGG